MNFVALLENQELSLGFVFNILKSLETDQEVESFISSYKNWHREYNQLMSEEELDYQFKTDLGFYLYRLDEDNKHDVVQKIQDLLERI